MQLYCASVGK